MTNQIKDTLRTFFNKHIPSKDIHDDSDIFQLGYVNSLFAMQIINFVEKEFSINVENDDLNINNFRSIENIFKFVSGKLAQTKIYNAVPV